MADGNRSLQILFRYLMLHFNSDDGLYVLIPRAKHRATLRDTATDTVIPLNQASITLAGGRQRMHAKAEPTTIDPNERLLSMEEGLLIKGRVKPQGECLNLRVVDERLNAVAFLPGGTLTGYPMEAFPELADTEPKQGPGANRKVTDTALYDLPLRDERYELVVSSSRGTIRLDVTDGGRFEVRNQDEKAGPLRRDRDVSNEEFQQLESLLEPHDSPAEISCDYVACLCAYCGTPR